MGKDTYTEMQLKIINGDIPLDKVGSNILARLRNKAILLNDQDLAQMIEVQLAQNKADSKARNLERAKKYYHETKEKGLSWQPAKTPVYSERQVKIIHNEIPYDSVTIRDLIAIRQKAVLNNDGVLADKMLDLITDKKAESAEKARLRNIERDRRLRENGTKGFSHKNKLNKEERGILSGHNDVSDYSLEHLYHIKHDDRQHDPGAYDDKVPDVPAPQFDRGPEVFGIVVGFRFLPPHNKQPTFLPAAFSVFSWLLLHLRFHRDQILALVF